MTEASLTAVKPAQATAQARALPAPGFHIPSLDGIRAMSFMIVFLAHAGLGKIVPGYFGLTLFFFLSGYLITTLLRVEYEATWDISLKQFYLRRVLRIFPPFYLVLAIAATLTALGAWHGSINAEGLGFQLAHLTNYYIIGHGWWEGLAPGTWVYWSLAIEEHFYLVFPLFYLWLSRRVPSAKTQFSILGCICALVLLWRVILVLGLDAPKDRIYVGTDTRIDAILAGCMLAVRHNPALEAVADERRLKLVWLPLGGAAVLASLTIREPAFEQTLRYTLQSFGLFPFFIAAVRWHDWGPFRLLNLPVVRYVGLLSYSMYLMHTTTLWALEQWTRWPMYAQATVALATLILMGSAIHYWIERPCANLRRRLSHAFAPRPASA